jgi:hypothetical protein
VTELAGVVAADARLDALTVPVAIEVPDSLDELEAGLEIVGSALAAGGWATAAVVYAWTEDRERGYHGHSNDEKSSLLSISEFAALNLRGLGTRDTVRNTGNAGRTASKQVTSNPRSSDNASRSPPTTSHYPAGAPTPMATNGSHPAGSSTGSALSSTSTSARHATARTSASRASRTTPKTTTGSPLPGGALRGVTHLSPTPDHGRGA